MKFGIYILPPQTITAACFINSTPPLSNTNPVLNNLNITLKPEPIVMELGIYVMPPKAISVA